MGCTAGVQVALWHPRAYVAHEPSCVYMTDVKAAAHEADSCHLNRMCPCTLAFVKLPLGEVA